MRDFRQVTLEMTRCYLKDEKSTLGPALMEPLSGYVRSRAIGKLAACSELFDPASHGSDVLKILLQVEGFYKKSKAFTVDDTKQVAKRAFELGERRCRITNKRLDYYFFRPQRINSAMRGRIEATRLYIDRVLGPIDAFARELPELVRLTSGATSTEPRKRSAPYQKLGLKPSCTPRAGPYLKSLYSYFGYGTCRPRYTSVNRVTFVPKSWKTDRTIACEPTGNLPLQLAFDSFVKGRLRNVGIDLSDQGTNQLKAYQGSIDGSYATIDLEGASDSLSLNTVAWLLPDDWFKFLSDIRSPFYNLEGGIGRYSKFSSMGNGATFALETLVFAAICAAFTKDFTVYGDDIIVPPDAVDPVMKLLRFFGFRVNSQKTHTTGFFRESCGVNCYLGRDITPFYLREWREILTDFHHNVNGLVRCARPGGLLQEYLADMCKRQPGVLYGPYTESTLGHVHVDTPFCWTRRYLRSGGKPRGNRPYYGASSPVFYTLVPKVVVKQVSDIRGLTLWYLAKQRVVRGVQTDAVRWIPEMGIRNLGVSQHSGLASLSTRSSAFSEVQSYVRKRTLYYPTFPRGIGGVIERGGTDHLYWWSDLLSRRKAAR